ncbi:MAG: hypothetical protein AAF152_01615 [Cyanobacteria bacterium P01_A01_bin.114]
MKLRTLTQRLSLVALLIVFGSATPIQAQTADSATDSATAADCVAAFGDYEMDEFEGIELTEEQSNAIAQAAEQLETQSDQVLSPEQLRAMEAADQRFESEFMAILTPEQQQLEREGTLDIESLSAEQQAALEQLESQFLENTEDWELSAQQIERLESYEKTYEETVLALLTPQQQERYLQNQFQLSYPDFARLNLSAEQRQQLIQIDEQFMQLIIDEDALDEDAFEQLEAQYETQLMGILDNAQKQQLEEIWAQQARLGEQCWETIEETGE